MEDRKRRNDRHSEPIPQSTSSESAMRSTEGFTNSAFKDLNRKPAEGWNCPPEVNKALSDATPGHPVKYGASSSVTEHGKTVIPSEGSSRSSEGSIPNRHA